MMWQETQIDLFERNLLKCSGRGPSKGVRDSKERARQMKVAADFVNIFDDHGAVMMEAEEAINPAKYVQKKGTHRAPVSKKKNKDIGNCIGNTDGGKTKGKGKKIKKGTQLQDGKNVIDEQQLQAKCIVIMEIIDSDLVPEAAISIVKNPTFIIKAEWNIRKCKGCKKEITKEEKAYPQNMVFRRIGLYGYMNRTINKWIENEQPIHFHLNMGCLRKHDPTMEMHYITTNDEFFIEMDEHQMSVLHGLGFLKPIAQKKTI